MDAGARCDIAGANDHSALLFAAVNGLHVVAQMLLPAEASLTDRTDDGSMALLLAARER